MAFGLAVPGRAVFHVHGEIIAALPASTPKLVVHVYILHCIQALIFTLCIKGVFYLDISQLRLFDLILQISSSLPHTYMNLGLSELRRALHASFEHSPDLL